jgi:exodeoxyribonuclease (lambda-induced)
MKIINCEQGDDDWIKARLGVVTASEMDKIITTEGKPSKQADGYKYKLLAEMILGHDIETFGGNKWTDIGKMLESDAVRFYELTHDETAPIGFIKNDAGTLGASPDRLVGDDGILEIKVPAPHTHVKYLLDNDALKKEYQQQNQFQLYVTERKFCDLMSYHPEMKPVLIRIEPDEKYFTTMDSLLKEFLADLAVKKARLIELGFMKESV